MKPTICRGGAVRRLTPKSRPRHQDRFPLTRQVDSDTPDRFASAWMGIQDLSAAVRPPAARGRLGLGQRDRAPPPRNNRRGSGRGDGDSGMVTQGRHQGRVMSALRTGPDCRALMANPTTREELAAALARGVGVVPAQVSDRLSEIQKSPSDVGLRIAEVVLTLCWEGDVSNPRLSIREAPSDPPKFAEGRAAPREPSFGTGRRAAPMLDACNYLKFLRSGRSLSGMMTLS